MGGYGTWETNHPPVPAATIPIRFSPPSAAFTVAVCFSICHHDGMNTDQPIQRCFGDLTVEIVQGDITRQPDIDAVVNAANAQLRPGGGVAGAIHRASGPELDRECRAHAPITPGDAVITRAYNLPNRAVIHVLGPVYGRDKPEEELLRACYRNALDLAEREKLTSIATPAISTGAFGYPVEEAAGAALSEIASIGGLLTSVLLIRFVLFSRHDFEIHRSFLQKTT